MTRLKTFTNTTKGVDTNRPITAKNAADFVALNHRFAIRYVPRVTYHDGDVTKDEVQTILKSGLGLMLVQHVAQAGWLATAGLGTAYGQMAASYADSCGYAHGATLWCDLESVGNTGQAVADYCNAWAKAVSARYLPGLYVGYEAGLTAKELYAKLTFHAYWSAYNLNTDLVPAVRGVQMRQLVAHPQDMPAGFSNQNMDIDLIHPDAMGSTPMLMFL